MVVLRVPSGAKAVPYPKSFANTSFEVLSLYLCQNLPIPSRTCTVLIPGFGVARPAFEMCM
jgi:hypothetical protein